MPYSYGTAPATEAPNTWDSIVPGDNGLEIAVRMYELDEGWLEVGEHGGGIGRRQESRVLEDKRVMVEPSNAST